MIATLAQLNTHETVYTLLFLQSSISSKKIFLWSNLVHLPVKLHHNLTPLPQILISMLSIRRFLAKAINLHVMGQKSNSFHFSPNLINVTKMKIPQLTVVLMARNVTWQIIFTVLAKDLITIILDLASQIQLLTFGDSHPLLDQWLCDNLVAKSAP